MGSNSCGFVVEVKRKEVVAAVLPMPEHWLPMSNLDLLLPPLNVGVFFCYKKSTDTTTTTTMHAHKSSSSSRVSTLKEALAEALVSFYAFAGGVVENRLGEPELLCNNRGVDFVHAYADVELHELDLHHPDDSVHGKLVPFKSHGVISVQGDDNCKIDLEKFHGESLEIIVGLDPSCNYVLQCPISLRAN
ncbi:hypothetical protein Vadar_002814 [Vaccinium darrowii]|uniref:Uncharacterized protein n=1 Tax=Vaccinium darrowii TaxID=229202 RepID=A0ACB7Y4Z8_9ERIC|nr:hypothetical protein Vadar_002814 [Vaccinium darrowii]